MNYAIVLYDPLNPNEADAIEIKKEHDPKVFLYLIEALSNRNEWVDIGFRSEKSLDKKDCFVVDFYFGLTDENEATLLVENIAKYINEKMNL